MADRGTSQARGLFPGYFQKYPLKESRTPSETVKIWGVNFKAFLAVVDTECDIYVLLGKICSRRFGSFARLWFSKPSRLFEASPDSHA